MKAASLLALVSCSEAFMPSGLISNRAALSLKSPTLDEVKAINGEKTVTTWECDEEAQCVEVPACDDEQCRTSLDVRIHGEWYDLTGT